MKIEKVSDTQVKFVLDKSDLQQRNIKLGEIAFGTEKIQHLFREMMEQAMVECDFHSDNTPLMVEAVPISTEGIMIIVTKVTDAEEQNENINLLSGIKNALKNKNLKLIDFKDKTVNEENISIFSFNTLDEVSMASKRLYGAFTGSNMLYKQKDKYYLLLENNVFSDGFTNEILDAVISEYGQKHVSTVIAKYYLDEHGELLVADPAIEKLAML